MAAGLEGVANDGVFIDARQASGLADAAAVLEVLEDGHGFVVGESCAEQGGALALGEALLAGAAGEHAALLRAVAEGDAEVALAAQAVVKALGVLAAEEVKVFHEGRSPKEVGTSGQRLPGIVEQPQRFGNVMGTPPTISTPCHFRKQVFYRPD